MSEIKNKDFFPHPSNLRNDRRMKRVMKDLPGGVGYGAVVMTIERLRCEDNYSYPIADLDLLSDEFNISLPILQTVISKYGFFELTSKENEEVFISPILNTLMEPYQERIKQARIAGNISAKKRKQKQEKQLQELSLFDSSERSLNVSTTEEKRKEEKRIENTRVDYISLSKNDESIFQNYLKNALQVQSPKLYAKTVLDSLNNIQDDNHQISVETFHKFTELYPELELNIKLE